MNNLHSLFHRNGNPYIGMEDHLVASDLHGWNEHGEHFHELFGDAKIIIEIGAWKGRSTIALAKACPNASIISVDTWLGSEEMYLDLNDDTRHGALRPRFGYPQLYYEWASNIVCARLDDRVTPIPLPSQIALRVIKAKGVKPDAVFIDADHSTESVRQDIAGSLELRPTVISGDDFLHWPSVAQGVRESLPNTHVMVENNGFWWARPFYAE